MSHQKLKLLFLVCIVLVIFSCQRENGIFICGDTITDIDGNVYNTVSIGTQCWTVENLKTAHYNDGTAIPTGLNDIEWQNDTIGAYGILYDDNINDAIYGKLYNWYAINTDKLAPADWHVSTDEDWKILITYLGGTDIAGSKMKSTTIWKTDVGATVNTNSSGFSGLPGGRREFYGRYIADYGIGNWWTSTIDSNSLAPIRYSFTYNNDNVVTLSEYKSTGFSVRCIKD